MNTVVTVDRSIGEFAYSPQPSPRARVSPGAVLRIETRDPRSGAITVGPPGTLHGFPPPPGGRTNALTGPILVEGAQPGDVLVVDVHDVTASPPGYMSADDSGRVVPSGRIGDRLIGIVDVRDGHVQWRNGIHYPARPMIGCVGVADPSEPSSGAVGRFGGNMDHNVLAAGCRLFLPVLVLGALFYVGDVHAAMGDGELSGGGVEIPAEVTLAVSLVRQRRLAGPRMETADRVVTTGWDMDFAAARRMATDDMITLMETCLHMNAVEAFMIISATGDLRIGQACGSMEMTLRLEMPRLPGLAALPA